MKLIFINKKIVLAKNKISLTKIKIVCMFNIRTSCAVLYHI